LTVEDYIPYLLACGAVPQKCSVGLPGVRASPPDHQELGVPDPNGTDDSPAEEAETIDEAPAEDDAPDDEAAADDAPAEEQAPDADSPAGEDAPADEEE
jgi:hypothetical protein